MKQDNMITMCFIYLLLLVLAIVLASVSLDKSINNKITTEEQNLLEQLLNNTYISSEGCFTAKCFTDNYIQPSSSNNARNLFRETVISQEFFSVSGGVLTCPTINSKTLNIDDTLQLTSNSIAFSNGLVLSDSGITSPNLFQMQADVSVSNTFQVGTFTTLERLALTVQDGTIVYDSTIGVLSVYQSSSWFLLFNASGVLSIQSTTLAITGTNINPSIDLIPTGITAGSYHAPTIQFDQYGMAISAVSNNVVSSITSSSLLVAGTSSIPTIDLIVTNTTGSYNMPTIQLNQYGIALSATSNTLTGTTNQIDVTGFPNPVISLNSAFIASKVNIAGDTMTGSLDSTFASSAMSPNFSMNAINGMFQSATNHVSFSTNGANRLDIDSTGVVTIAALPTGVLKSTSGLLSVGLVQNTEIATQTPFSQPNSIVSRDGSNNFEANMISLSGTTTFGTDVATKDYVDIKAGAGLSVKQPVIVVSVTPISSPPTGPQTIDGVLLVNGNRVLLVNQGSAIENGAWVVAAGAWTRPTDFANGTLAGAAYFLVQMGTIYTGSSWVCSTPTVTIGAGNLSFSQFSTPQSATGSNDSVTNATVYKSASGSTLHFRSLLNDPNQYLTMTDQTDDVKFVVNASPSAGLNTIVARDGAGNFAANVITATSIVGANVVTNTTNFSVVGNVVVFADTLGKVILDSTHSLSEYLQLAGGTMTGALTTSAGGVGSPGLFIGGSTCALSSSAGAFQISLSNTLAFSLGSVLTAGVLHSSSGSIITSSLIVNADVSASAAIVDTKLATISTSGKVLNSATTATPASVINTIVSRDGALGFSCDGGTIYATVLDSKIGTISIGPSSSTSVSIGQAGRTTLIKGTADIQTIDRTGTMFIGGTSATSLSLGRSGITTTILGTCSVATIDTAATLNIGRSTATAVAIGIPSSTTSIFGTVQLSGSTIANAISATTIVASSTISAATSISSPLYAIPSTSNLAGFGSLTGGQATVTHSAVGSGYIVMVTRSDGGSGSLQYGVLSVIARSAGSFFVKSLLNNGLDATSDTGGFMYFIIGQP
jgi:hypothetical protein